MRHSNQHKKPSRRKRASAAHAATGSLSAPLPTDMAALGLPLASPKSATPSDSKRKTRPGPPKTLIYTDIELSQWRDYPQIETDSLWLFNGRDKSNGHQLDYHGNCVPQILTQLISRYTRPDEIILDLFLGSGTSAIEAGNLNRRLIGVELQPKMANYVKEKLEEQGKASQVKVITGDSRCLKTTGPAIEKALRQFDSKQAQFLFLHPPYADIIHFSESERDLSNAESNEAFLDSFEAVCRQGFDNLEPGRFAGLVIGDKYENGELIPLGFQCMERMNRVGFRTKSIIVKNISGNEKAKGKMNNLWRYRALAGGFYVFKHEYVLLFQKPAASKGKSKSEPKRASL
jgi:16S rRNA G966 N2-methylase RsmD